MPQQQPPDKLDGIDIEQIEEMIRGEGWQHVRARLAKCEAQIFEQWYSGGSPESVEFLRGKLHGIRLAVRKPQEMVAEIRQGLAK